MGEQATKKMEIVGMYLGMNNMKAQFPGRTFATLIYELFGMRRGERNSSVVDTKGRKDSVAPK